MKKILLFVLITLFTLSLFSCQKEEIPDEKSPSQAIEEQEKTPAIKEEEEPEIPEVPEEPKEEDKFPYVGEITATLDSGDIILPAEDENTKEILIPFPEDFTYGYTEPEIVAPEDFDWGEYMPFVRYSVGSCGEVGWPRYTYAFLGKDIKTLDEGHKFYEKLNSKYKKTFEYSLDDTIDWFPLSVQEDAIPLVAESRVVWVSTDANEVVNYYLEKAESYYSEHMGWDITVWDGKYEIFENEKLSSTETVKEELYGYREGDKDFDYQGNKYFNKSFNTSSDSNDTNYHMLSNADLNIIYDLDKMKLKYKIAFDMGDKYSHKYYKVKQLIDGRYLVIMFYPMFGGENCNNTYIYDLEEGKMEKINGYSFNMLLSPDRKYLIYSRESWSNTEVNSIVNYNYDLKHGFYIKNLENGQTTFYEYDIEYPKSTQSINWINEEKLKAIIGENNNILQADTEILLDGENVSLGEIYFHSSEKKAIDADLSIAYTDMNGDGSEETLIRDSLGDTLIIFQDNTARYFSYKAMDEIKSNGVCSFRVSLDPLIYGEAKLTSDGEKELWRIEESETEIKYFVDRQEVSAKEFETYDAQRELTLLDFSPFKIFEG